MDDKLIAAYTAALIAAYTAAIADLRQAPDGWDEDSLRVAIRVLVTRRMELENWETFTPVEVPD
jgi:hypothetical protein